MRRKFEKVWGGKEGKGSEIQEDVLSKQTPRISFDLVKINRRGARQKRELVFSDDGISNMKGKSRQWFFHINDLFGLEPGRQGQSTSPSSSSSSSQKSSNTSSSSSDPNGTKPVLNLKVIKKYQFECESEEQLARLTKVFYQLYSDRLPINNSQHYNGHGAYIGDYVIGQQQQQNNEIESMSMNTGSPSGQVPNSQLSSSPSGNTMSTTQLGAASATNTGSSNNLYQQDAPSISQQQQLAAFMGKKIGIHSFELLKVIGEGSFSKVCLVRKKDTRQIYALKVLDKSEIKRRNQVEHTITEKRVLSNHRHPFIIKMYHSFQAEDKLYSKFFVHCLCNDSCL